MNSSSFLKTLRSLSSEETKRYEELINSPYFNKNSNVIKLFRYIKKFSPDFENENLKKEIIWNKTFGGREFNYGVMKNLIHELNKLLEKFLIQEGYSRNELRQKLDLLNELYNKGLLSEFEKNVTIFRKNLSTMKIGSDYYFYSFMIESLELRKTDNFLEVKNKKYGDYTAFNENLISYFFTYLFTGNHRALNVANMYKINSENKYLNKTLDFFEKEYLGIDIISTWYYYAVRLAIQNRNEDLYYEFKDYILKNFDKYNQLYRYNSCTVLLRTCYDITLTDDTKFASETLNVIKFMMERNILKGSPDEFIDATFFFCAIEIAAHHNETELCESYINKCKDYLHPSLKEDYLNLGMMVLRRSQKKYDESMLYLSKVISNNPLQKLTLKEFELKNYYDLGYFDEMYPLIKNIKNFLNNDKIFSPIVIECIGNLMNYLKKVLDIKLSNLDKRTKKISYEKLEMDISGKNIFNKSWLKGIIKEQKG